MVHFYSFACYSLYMVSIVNDANVLLVFWFTLDLLTFVFVYNYKFVS